MDIFRNVLLERERREPQSLEERELVAKQITWAQLDLAAAHIADKNGTSAREILYAVLQKVPYDRYAQALWERLNRSEIVVQP